jgi:PAS domain-containing protein
MYRFLEGAADQYMTRAVTIIFANDSFLSLAGYGREEEVLGQSFEFSCLLAS